MATIIDVAREAGVSTATVSRVINGNTHINENTKRKVLSAMEKLSYSPNSVARSLARGRIDCIGFMVRDLYMPFWAQLAHEAEKYAIQHGCSLMIMSAPHDLDEYVTAYNKLVSSMVSGIITFYMEGAAELIRNSGVPTLTVANPANIPSISSNDEQGGIFAARHLISRGCRNLILLSGELSADRTCNLRTYGFMDECEKSGVRYRIYEIEFSRLQDHDLAGTISKVFYENPDFDGIFASNDVAATICLSTALSLGYRVPEDKKIVGFDDIYFCSMMYPALTTIRQDYDTLARKAVETLIDMINGRNVPDRQQLPVELVVRGTT